MPPEDNQFREWLNPAAGIQAKLGQSNIVLLAIVNPD
jgi:hypothetical protein